MFHLRKIEPDCVKPKWVSSYPLIKNWNAFHQTWSLANLGDKVCIQFCSEIVFVIVN